MDDKGIIELFFKRSEQAIREMESMYGAFCHRIAYNILRDHHDAEESVNDGYLRVWHAIPPTYPKNLQAFLGKIIRNISLNKVVYKKSLKRGAGHADIVAEEFMHALPSADRVEEKVETHAFVDTVNTFLATLPAEKRICFCRRYWYLDSISDIAEAVGKSESAVKMMLLRLRKDLKAHLEKEGIRC